MNYEQAVNFARDLAEKLKACSDAAFDAADDAELVIVQEGPGEHDREQSFIVCYDGDTEVREGTFYVLGATDMETDSWSVQELAENGDIFLYTGEAVFQIRHD
jgi:hypothetical protein